MVAEDLFAPLRPVEPQRLTRLRRRLAAAADVTGVLDVGYTVVDSPIGPLLLAATSAGLVRVAFAGEGHEIVLARLAEQVGPRVLEAPDRLAPVAAELAEYFAGRRRSFEVAVDLRLAGGFRRVVLERLRQVGYGRTATYAGLAAAAGSPRAVRAVGSACATNPVPIVVPCHRVLRTDGALGGYRGGVAAKATLLALEGVATATTGSAR